VGKTSIQSMFPTKIISRPSNNLTLGKPDPIWQIAPLRTSAFLSTLWISHSALSDFENCPRLYYFKSIYRHPVTNHKIQVASPYLSLGSVVHEIIEEMRVMEPEKRFTASLEERLEQLWDTYGGKRGGFVDKEQEQQFKERGKKMLQRVERNAEVLKGAICQIGSGFPKVRLFEGRDIILVGNIDWIEVLPTGKLHIIDFKTGQKEEAAQSLQLPIYLILATYNVQEPIAKTSYWYLERDDTPVSMHLKPLKEYVPVIRQKALRLEAALAKNQLTCQSGYKNCFHCRKYDMVTSGNAEHVGYDEKMRKDLYFVPQKTGK